MKEKDVKVMEHLKKIHDKDIKVMNKIEDKL